MLVLSYNLQILLTFIYIIIYTFKNAQIDHPVCNSRGDHE